MVSNRITESISGFTIPLSIVVIHALLTFLPLSGSRYLFKTLYRYLSSRFIKSKKILIYGAGNSGLVTYNALVDNVKSRIEVVAFIDDDKKKTKKKSTEFLF